MERKGNSICMDLKDRFGYFELEEKTVFEAKALGSDNHLVFLMAGSIEIIYGDLYPRIIGEGNMIFLTPLSHCICTVQSPLKMIVLAIEGLNYSCDQFIFQSLTPIFSLLKYEFRELEIRPALTCFLELIRAYLQNNVMPVQFYTEKIKELFIVLRAYYEAEELAMFFYPLLGKNMEFKKMITDNYLRVKNASEYADLCGYSLGTFQRKFKDVFGETVYQWMQRQKAEQIKHYLMTTDISLKELADELGFASPAHLNKFCKIWFEMTPSEVRKTFMLKKNLR